MEAFIEIVQPDVGRPFRALAHAGDAFPMYWHRHAEYELTYGSAGGELRVGDLVERLAEPRAILLGPQLPHAWSEEAPFEHRVVQFRGDWLGAGFLDTVGCEGLAALLALSERGLAVDGPDAERIGGALADLLPRTGMGAITGLLDLLGAFAAASPREILVAGAASGIDLRLHRVSEWIDRNAAEDISLAAAAAVLDMHPQAFARYFRRVSGHSFVGYLGHVRVRNACVLLRAGGLRITDVALRVGFGTVANFNRTFLRLRRMTPSDYCRRVRD